MSQDHDNPTSAAAAPAPEASVNSTTETTKPTPLEAALSMEAAPTEEPAQSAVDSETPHPDAEAAPAAEEAPGAEEMSQLIEQYGEPHEAPAQSEILEGKVVAYTEQGVVVDLGLKSEGLVPAAEFTETDVPRPEPGSKSNGRAKRRMDTSCSHTRGCCAAGCGRRSTRRTRPRRR